MIRTSLCVFAAVAMLSAGAMAQEPPGKGSGAGPAIPGSSASSYEMHWSSNPGVFNTETSDPGFVAHDHGRP